MKKFLLAAICMLLVGFSSRATAVGYVNGDGRDGSRGMEVRQW